MSSQKAKYKGFFYQVIKEDARFVTLEGLGAKFRVPKEEVIYDKKREEKMEEAPIEDRHELVKKKEEKPLPIAAADKGFVSKTEEKKPVADQNPNKGSVPIKPQLKNDKLSDELEKLRLEMRSDFGDLDKLEEDGESGGVATGCAAGPSTNTASVAPFNAKLGAMSKRKIEEQAEDITTIKNHIEHLKDLIRQAPTEDKIKLRQILQGEKDKLKKLDETYIDSEDSEEELIDEDGDGGGDAGSDSDDAGSQSTGTLTANIAVVPTVIGTSPTHKSSCITAGGKLLLKQSSPMHSNGKKKAVIKEEGETGSTGGGGSVGMSPPAGVPPNAATPEEIALYIASKK